MKIKVENKKINLQELWHEWLNAQKNRFKKWFKIQVKKKLITCGT